MLRSTFPPPLVRSRSLSPLCADTRSHGAEFSATMRFAAALSSVFFFFFFFFFFFYFFFFFFCGSVQLLRPAAGTPLQSASPVQVSVAAGGAAVLPCGRVSGGASRASTVEWTRMDAVPLTVHVLRGGEELQKEQAEQFRGRTEVLRGGALLLSGTRRDDSGTYRCVLLTETQRPEPRTVVSLLVVQVSPVSLSVTRTPSNQLQVLCESSGWSEEPRLSLLDAGGTVLSRVPVRSWRRGDGLHAVSARLDAGNGTVTCRVDVPGTNLSQQSHVHVSDELDAAPQRGGCVLASLCCLLLPCVVVVAAAIAAALFLFPPQTAEKLRASLRRLAGLVLRLMARDAEGRPGQTLQECGDIHNVETTGASEDTARANESVCGEARGVEASILLAASDLPALQQFKETLCSVGRSLGVPPALLAAIISRQSRAGAILSTDGFGEVDRNCFGLMQINKHYHAVKGTPHSREHVDQGATFLIQLLRTMRRTKPGWSQEQQLKGALACYAAGEDRVIPLSYEQLDSVTPHGDFANDVIARAQWLAKNGF